MEASDTEARSFKPIGAGVIGGSEQSNVGAGN